MSDESKSKSLDKPIVTVLVIAAFLVIGGFIAKRYFFDRPPKIVSVAGDITDDPLCMYVSDKLQLNCVVGLAAESVLGPGHFVAYPANAAAHTKVPFPDGDLFSSSCLVPGEQAETLLAALKKQEQENTFTVDEITYKLDRKFQIGADLPIPRLRDLTLKAGPKMTEIQDITMSAPHAWIKLIDVNVFLDVLANSGIRKRCIDNLLTSNYQVVSKALIARDVDVKVTDKTGKSIDLSVAAKVGQVSVAGGGGANTDVDQKINTASTTPVVMGVKFLNPDVFKQQPKLLESVVYSPSGQVTVSVSGNGGEGILSSRTEAGTLGQKVTVNSQGGESSECDGGFERKKSLANLSSLAIAKSSETIEFSTAGEIAGGHYATGPCVFSRPTGGGHDNGVSAVYSFDTYVRATVRSDDLTSLKVQYTGIPPGSRLEVRDPRGEPLSSLQGSAVLTSLQGDGTLEFSLRGAGVYIARLAETFQRSVNGASRLTIDDKGSFSVTAH